MTQTRGWVLYDGDCGFCSWWVPFWASTLKNRGFEIAPLQAEWVSKRLKMPIETLLNDIRLLLADGTLLSGADAYRFVLRRIWWATPLYLFAILPVTRNLFDWCYRKFAISRYGISKLCKLPPSQ